MFKATRQRLSYIDKLRKLLGKKYDPEVQLRLSRSLAEEADFFKTEAWGRVCVLLEDTITECKNMVFQNVLDKDNQEVVEFQIALAEVCMRILQLTEQIKQDGDEAIRKAQFVNSAEELGVDASQGLLSRLMGERS